MKPLLSLGALLILSCSVAPASPPSPAPSRPVSFRLDVLPVLREHCQRCHSKSTPGSVDAELFDAWGEPNYEAIREALPKMVEEIDKGKMPLGQPGLVSQAQRALLQEWGKAGTPNN